MAAPLTKSRWECQTRPATNLRGLGIRRATPFLITKTPPLGGPELFEPPSPTNMWPTPQANEVGVFSPVAASCTGCPLVDVGGGGGGALVASAAGAVSAKAAATAIPAVASVRMVMR